LTAQGADLRLELFCAEPPLLGEILADTSDQPSVQERHAVARVEPARRRMVEVASLQHVERVSPRRRQ
jgi:hypothetical protein